MAGLRQGLDEDGDMRKRYVDLERMARRLQRERRDRERAVANLQHFEVTRPCAHRRGLGTSVSTGHISEQWAVK